MTQELCDKVFSEDYFMLKCCHDKYKTQEMCDKAVDSCLLALKFVPDLFVTTKMIEQVDSVLFYNDYMVFGDLGSDFVTFFSEDIGLNSITFVNFNLDDDHFDYCDSETINHVRVMGWHDQYKQRKASKKDR